MKDNSEKKYYSLTEDATLKELKTSKKGLSDQEVEHRRQTYGLNELKTEKGVHPIKIFIEQFSSPLIWILLCALIVSVFPLNSSV